ncbi:MAG: S-methyl-5'-thioadenosine phosphorylase [Acidibacillus sp.]|uniref:Purine nucleoside phosphorylase n=1 Tax=Sulfoacidibacillus ferrooxidans TaxID=2005001 RepID=A0A9X2ACY4_9BACL|nr:S-methyl-5'-thioadenosine phosphorylase [Sulfoacidibacillus ferrooxidans]MCI0184269.1 S-methyl-5'-thioinosine phosphorylase [Sulfoacidibacillus ferrooxidans]MCY0894527.1 S-methyl-5'-thioadenosine phosphorylase [Acidibacillus sp.]
MIHADYAIIGGTGVYDPALLTNAHEEQIETHYGMANCTIGEFKGKSIAFMPRHGKAHHVPPHQVNYKANIQALVDIGVKQVFATAAVGSMRQTLPPGALVIVDQFLDFTKNRPLTFFEDGEPVTHTDMTDPYCGRLRRHLSKTAQQLGIVAAPGGTYVCTEGPRFESPAEIRMFAQLGGDVVGMTSIPETVLAKERGLCYSTVAMVTNYCSGMTGAPLTHQEVLDEMAKNVHQIRTLFFEAIATLDTTVACACESASGAM